MIHDTPTAEEAEPQRADTYPSSTVQAICAPAIEILKNIKSFVVNLLFEGAFTRVMRLAAVGSSFNGPRSGRDPSPFPGRFGLRIWEPEAFRRLDGQAIWVVGSGSTSALEGKVMVLPGLLVLRC